MPGGYLGVALDGAVVAEQPLNADGFHHRKQSVSARETSRECQTSGRGTIPPEMAEESLDDAVVATRAFAGLGEPASRTVCRQRVWRY